MRSCVRLPGRSSALSDCADQWEQQVLASSTLAGCIRDVLVCQHPVFVFQRKLKLENLKAKFAFDFRGLPSNSPPVGAALFSDGRVIGGQFSDGKPPREKKSKNLISHPVVMWISRLTHQRFRVFPPDVSRWDCTIAFSRPPNSPGSARGLPVSPYLWPIGAKHC
jgi:hypothetical protein